MKVSEIFPNPVNLLSLNMFLQAAHDAGLTDSNVGTEVHIDRINVDGKPAVVLTVEGTPHPE